MTILFAASEMNPLARVGSLGDVVEALPAALSALGHEVSVVIPCYRGLRERTELAVRETGVRVGVLMGGDLLEAAVLECTAPNGMQVFLLQRDEFFDRAGLYGNEGRDYEDNARRFIFFSRAVVELARRILPPPEILHVHNWQTALIPALVKDRRLPFKTVLTIHQIAQQGSFGASDFGLTGLPGDYFTPGRGVEFYGRMNLLKGGILLADAVTTVSERHARELRTPEAGRGLDAVMRENARKVTGILNGLDKTACDPAVDRQLPATYSPADLKGKRVCREALLSEAGLDPAPRGPVFAMVSRPALQKGIEFLLPTLDRLLADDVRLFILEEGDPAYERELMIASRRHHGRFAYRREAGTRLSHLVHAGADINLIPSFYDPREVTAMHGLKYGTLPLAPATGGVFEVIQDFDATANSGNGFLFFASSADALWDTMGRAKRCFQDAASWRALMIRAMKADFSWERAARRYEAVYESAIRGG